jgi:hypothetical protein
MKGAQGSVDLRQGVRGETHNKILDSLLHQEVSKESYERVSSFVKILNKTKINMVLLKSLSFGGVPNECRGLRGVVWRLLFNCLPPEPQKWEHALKTQQAEYDSYKRDLVVIPTLPRMEPGKQVLQLVEVADHPLSLGQESRWCRFYQDDDARKQINKDIRRTRKDVPFFFEMAHDSDEESKSCSLFIPSTAQITGIDSDDTMAVQATGESHRHVMARILLIYSKLNKGVAYVQGMNELLAVIYYCLYHYSPPCLKEYLESDSFRCFTFVMSELRDEYMRALDSEESGIRGQIRKISDILCRVDTEYFTFLKSNKIEMDMYALRWVMLILAQDFQIEDVIRLWDTIMSDSEKYTFLNYVVVQLVLDAKNDVMNSDFHVALKRFQEMPQGLELPPLLTRAAKLVALDQDKDDYLIPQH